MRAVLSLRLVMRAHQERRQSDLWVENKIAKQELQRKPIILWGEDRLLSEDVQRQCSL